MIEVVWCGLVVGAVASLVFVAVIGASYLVAPQVWLADLTRGERQPPNMVEAAMWAGAVALVLFCASVVAAWWAVSTLAAGWWAAFLAAYIVQLVINLVDLLFIDIVLYVHVRPQAMQIEGVEPLEGYWPHVRDALNGLVIGAVMALLAAAIAQGFAS